MALKAAIVGLGRIASLLEKDALREKPCTHAGAVAANPGLILCGGADIDAERRARFAETWKVPVYDSAETLIKQERPAILHVATHPDTHEQYCFLAARLGVPVVVCEKPLADTLAGARRIAALHESGTITVITNHERRYAADYERARDILAKGERLGPAAGVKGTLYMGKNRRLIDQLWHDGTHLADAAMFLTGAVLKHRNIISGGVPSVKGLPALAGGLRGRGGKGCLDARGGTAYLLGVLEKPAIPATAPLPFLFELGAERDHLVFELEFSCERGKLRIGNGIFEVWESEESPYAEGFRSLEKREEGFAGGTGCFSGMIADALTAARERLAGKVPAPRSGAADGLRVIEYLHSVKTWR